MYILLYRLILFLRHMIPFLTYMFKWKKSMQRKKVLLQMVGMQLKERGGWTWDCHAYNFVSFLWTISVGVFIKQFQRVEWPGVSLILYECLLWLLKRAFCWIEKVSSGHSYIYPGVSQSPTRVTYSILTDEMDFKTFLWNISLEFILFSPKNQNIIWFIFWGIYAHQNFFYKFWILMVCTVC